jgi:hypothetical protein
MAGPDTLFEQLVFSGGGTRCMWQGGFLHVLRRERPIHPVRVVGVSGGALASCGFVTHRGTKVRDTMMDLFSRHDRNLPLHEPFDGEAGNSPHQQMYQDVVETCIGDDEARAAIADGPSLQILIARPPSLGWAKLSGAAMTLAYLADTKVRSTPHLAWPEAAGLKGEMGDANAAARDGRIVALVSAAATIPPAFDPPLWDGKPVIDAGMVDQAPLPDPDEGRTLILLTKRFRNLPEVEGRLYVHPSDEVPADKIDFTDPGKLQETWDMGEEDARRMLRDGQL